MADEDVCLAALAAIADGQAPETMDRHGIRRIETVVPGGHYRRRATVLLDTAELLPSQMIFRLYTESLLQVFGPLRRVVLGDALVTDQGAVITRGGALVEESCWEFLAHGHVPYGLERSADDRFRRVAPPAAAIEAPSLLVKRPWWRNYGHWLVDAASLLALVVRRGIGGFEQIVIGAAEEPRLHAVFRATLARVAPGIPVLEHPDTALWAFRELHYVEPVRRPPLFTLPEAIGALRDAVLGDAVLGDAARLRPGARRLFVSRRSYGRRALANEAEIIAVCGRHGFEVVCPEELAFAGQVALFADAAAVVGVKGAGLSNVVFAPKGASVVALSPADFPDPFFWDVAAGRGQGYSEIFGRLVATDRSQGGNPFVIDPGRLDAMLRRVLPPARAPGPAPSPVMRAGGPGRAPSEPPTLAGEFYQASLARMHARLDPRTYLEIGSVKGETLALSRCRSVAIDPAFKTAVSLPGAMPALFLFQGTSDEFFESCDLAGLLGGPVDLAFLDGMHLFEFLLRDFINTERHCHRGSVIVLHNCLPPDLGMTGRDRIAVQSRPDARFPGWWTGDVWKTADILLRHRPDLDILALDTPPTGLVVVRNLDPASTVLRDSYDAIVERHGALSGTPALAAYFARLRVCPAAVVDGFEPIGP